MKNIALSFIISLTLYGCILGGTHGAIKFYKYPVKKDLLQEAIESVIANNPNIQRDSSKYNVVLVDGGKKDTLWDNHYNDTTNYVTIFIKYDSSFYKYTFRYVGDSKDWDTAQTSSIFIAYAYNAKHEGGSRGGNIEEHGPGFIRDLIESFEKVLVNRIDEKLAVKHTVEQ